VAKVLVTGVGYIGTHILCALAAAGRRAVCIDNYVNSSPASLRRVRQIAPGAVETQRIFGDNYPTKDGTGVRDDIHVLDLGEGRVAALDALDRAPRAAVMTVNLGTGQGYSALELIETFERANGVPHRIVERPDIAVCYADAPLANKELGWAAKRGIAQMCRDAWRWQ
jgi:UDP-glucose 4-epimerase